MTPVGGGSVALAVPTHPTDPSALPDPCAARAAQVQGSVQGCRSLFLAEHGGAGPLPPSTGEQRSALGPSACHAQREPHPHPVPLRPPRCRAANPLFPAHLHCLAWMEDGDRQCAHPSLILASAAALLSPVLLFPLPEPLWCFFPSMPVLRGTRSSQGHASWGWQREGRDLVCRQDYGKGGTACALPLCPSSCHTSGLGCCPSQGLRIGSVGAFWCHPPRCRFWRLLEEAAEPLRLCNADLLPHSIPASSYGAVPCWELLLSPAQSPWGLCTPGQCPCPAPPALSLLPSPCPAAALFGTSV